jgi:hypothetical protein
VYCTCLDFDFGAGYDYPDLPGLGIDKLNSEWKFIIKLVPIKNKSTTTINKI